MRAHGLGEVALRVGARWWCWRVAFDFMNGFHDAANSIATVVSTGVLKPWQAVAVAAFFNVRRRGHLPPHGRRHHRQGHRRPGVVDHHVVFGALIGAIFWNSLTWWWACRRAPRTR